MTLATGTHLGPYEVLAPLGAGGMGEVYRARDTRLGRDVAIKVLPDAVARDPDRLARFEREARTVAGLNHPNIVVLHSIEEEGGVRFITMELVEGERLDRYIQPSGLPLSRVLELSIPLTEALVAAHEKGVVHRDLKPANVMVTRDGRVKVLDFGLAKLERPGSEVAATQAPTMESPISAAGQVVGTVPYMAPEQVRGEAADARTDLFALGIMMYQLASGRRPFAGQTPADLSSAILRDTPAPLASIRADLPRDLGRIVDRCLEKDPRRRFQTALDVRNELCGLKRTLESAGLEPGKGAAKETPSIAVLPFVNMSRDEENEYFSDGLSEELLNVLAKIPELKVTGRTSSFAFKGKQEDLRDIGRKLGVGTLLEGSVRKAGNRVRITAQLIKVADGFHMWSETYDRVLDDIFAVQDDIARSVSTALHVTLLGKPAAVSKTNAESYQLVLQGNHFVLQNTGPALARAVSLYREAIDKSPDDPLAWAGLARAYAFQAFYGHADVNESHKSARQAVERALTIDENLADAHEVMGTILASLEFRWKEASEALRKARMLAPGASGPMVTMSIYEGAFGRIEEALRLARRAQEIDPLNPGVHMNLGRLESRGSDLKAACEAYLRALELSPGTASVHSSLGLLYLRRGMGAEAIAEIQKDASTGYREYALAIAYHALGMQQESDVALARLLTEGEQWGYQFAAAHAGRGEVDEAFRWLERSYELHDSGLALAKVSWTLENLHSDPRWPRFLEKVGLGE
jgi:serine/threonine protein kinase/tetratricopeptide (TPR) repeat protein